MRTRQMSHFLAPKHDSDDCRCFVTFCEFISAEHCLLVLTENMLMVSVFLATGTLSTDEACAAVCQVHHINRKLMHEVRFLEE